MFSRFSNYMYYSIGAWCLVSIAMSVVCTFLTRCSLGCKELETRFYLSQIVAKNLLFLIDGYHWSYLMFTILCKADILIIYVSTDLYLRVKDWRDTRTGVTCIVFLLIEINKFQNLSRFFENGNCTLKLYVYLYIITSIGNIHILEWISFVPRSLETRDF